jgi:hypothetical protein
MLKKTKTRFALCLIVSIIGPFWETNSLSTGIEDTKPPLIPSYRALLIENIDSNEKSRTIQMIDLQYMQMSQSNRRGTIEEQIVHGDLFKHYFKCLSYVKSPVESYTRKTLLEQERLCKEHHDKMINLINSQNEDVKKRLETHYKFKWKSSLEGSIS